MDAMDKELDHLLLMIERMPDGEMKDKLLERYDGYRKKFEDNPRDITVISPTGMEILWFETDVKMFTDGMPNVDPLRDYHVLQPLQVNGKNGKSSEIQEIESILAEILDSKILSNDIDSLKNTIDEIQEEYKGLGSKSQALEQKIAESRYTLMKGLLKGDRIEEATKLAEQFNEDMSLFLYKKLSPQIDTLRKSGRLQDALFLAKYCKDGDPKETDLEFWERLINIEEPELDYSLPKEEIQEPIAVKKEGLLERLKKKREQRIIDKKTEKESKIKVMHIRFDSTSDFHHMNKKDCMRVSKAISEETDGKRKANIRVVFDEGITEVTLPEPPYKDLDVLSGLIPKYIRKVEIPSTAIRICPNAFAGCSNLQQIDLSKTKVKQIGKDAFCCSGISSIQFPDCLERIDDGAFEECENLKSIDLSHTSVTEIGKDAFRGWYGYDPYDFEYHSRISGIEEVLLPKSVEKIGEGAFVLCPLKRVTAPRKFEEYFNNIKNPHEFLVNHPQKPTIEYFEDVNDKSKNEDKILQPRDGSLREKLKMLKSENLRNEALKKIEATLNPEISANIQPEISQ